MSSSAQKWAHDVFLSFRGPDARMTFVAHLNTALRNAGIDVFIDNDMESGEQISKALLSAIQGSFCAIVVLSKNFASSSWCLNELVAILDCQKFSNQIVVPIFYHVDPSDVRSQTGPYANAFSGKDMRDVQRWKAALTTIGYLSGYHLDGQSDESKSITLIVDKFKDKIKNRNKEVHQVPQVYPMTGELQSVNTQAQMSTTGLNSGPYWNQYRSNNGIGPIVGQNNGKSNSPGFGSVSSFSDPSVSQISTTWGSNSGPTIQISDSFSFGTASVSSTSRISYTGGSNSGPIFSNSVSSGPISLSSRPSTSQMSQPVTPPHTSWCPCPQCSSLRKSHGF